MNLETFNTDDLSRRLFKMLDSLWISKLNNDFPNTILKLMNGRFMNISIDTSNLQDPETWDGKITMEVHNYSAWIVGQRVVHPIICACTPSSIEIDGDFVTFKWERP